MSPVVTGSQRLALAGVIVLCGVGLQAANGGGYRVVSLRRAELARVLAPHGLEGRPDRVERPPGGSGLRVLLRGGSVAEIDCSGEVDQRRIPSSRSFFDRTGGVFAWYGEDGLHFATGPAEADDEDLFWVTQDGSLFLMGDVWGPTASGGPIRVRSTEPPYALVGVIPSLGRNAKLWSSGNELLAVGPTSTSDERLAVVRLVRDEQGLRETERITLSEPPHWIGGRLVALDVNPERPELLLAYFRDPPFSSKLFTYDLDASRYEKVGDPGEFNLFATCDPLASD